MNRQTHSMKKATRPQRRRIFVGCEGAGEGGYAARLQSLLDARGLSVALDIVILGPGVGDPHEIVRKAASKAKTSAERKGKHSGRYVLLDADRHEASTDIGRRTLDLARKHDMTLVWQNPCHEALLLLHLPGCGNRRPITTADALSALVRLWPTYDKPMSSLELAPMIDEDAVLRVSQVELGLRDFLVAVGLIHEGRTRRVRKDS